MMNINLKAGDIVRIENAYFKNSNGLYFVTRCPGDAGWSGKDYSLEKICRNGKISKGKYTTSSWPLLCLTNDRVKNAEARAWNKEYATIEVVEGINTEEIVAYFQGKADECKDAYEYYEWNYGEESAITKQYKEVMEHYMDVVKRMSPAEQPEPEEVAIETPEAPLEAVKCAETAQKRESRTYYPISEENAYLANMANSFREYHKGNATEEYRSYCDKAYDILDRIRESKPDQAEKAEKKADYYCRKLAQYFNDYYRNEASCPSVMISGPANFPAKKKERQNSRRETLNNTWKYLENYLEKLEDILTDDQPIKSGDTDAIGKLKAKIEQLEKEHEMHMACNQYYKKNGTLDGFEGLEEKEKAGIESFLQRCPSFPPFITYNETANIRRYKQRLEKLVKEKESGNKETVETRTDNSEIFNVIENKEIMRLQIVFDSIPPESARDLLKKNGFRWSPKNKAWQRQLTDNARYAYKSIKGELIEAMAG